MCVSLFVCVFVCVHRGGRMEIGLGSSRRTDFWFRPSHTYNNVQLGHQFKVFHHLDVSSTIRLTRATFSNQQTTTRSLVGIDQPQQIPPPPEIKQINKKIWKRIRRLLFDHILHGMGEHCFLVSQAIVHAKSVDWCHESLGTLSVITNRVRPSMPSTIVDLSYVF